jgi:predicted transcriptional regulator
MLDHGYLQERNKIRRKKKKKGKGKPVEGSPPKLRMRNFKSSFGLGTEWYERRRRK